MAKSILTYTDEDWVTAAINCSRGELSRMKRFARRAGMMGTKSLPAIKIRTVSEAGDLERAANTEKMAAFNKDVQSWQQQTIQDLRGSLSSTGVTGGELYESLHGTKRSNKYGEITQIGFSFARQGIYIYRGAYRGFGGWKGSHWSYRKKTPQGWINTSEERSTKSSSLGRLLSSNMRRKDWFNPVIDRKIGELARIVAEYCSDLVLDDSSIYLK